MLNGGSIADAAGNAAVLTLADPGQTGSLAANSNLVIDTTPPTITAVVSSSTNGSYGIDAVIDITVGFSEAVLVDTTGGKPTLQLETGSSDRYAPTPPAPAATHSPSNTPFKPAIPPQISISSPQQLSNSMAAPSMTLRAMQPSSPSLLPVKPAPLVTMQSW